MCIIIDLENLRKYFHAQMLGIGTGSRETDGADTMFEGR